MQKLLADRTRQSFVALDKTAKKKKKRSPLYKFTPLIVNRTECDKLENVKFVTVFHSRLLKESG